MLTSQYKIFARHLSLLSKNRLQGSAMGFCQIESRMNKNQTQIYTQIQKHYFASKKPKIPQEKQQKVQTQVNKSLQDSQFLWKVNLMFNLAGIGAGFYFPNEALMFVLTSNSLLQVYESSKSINRLKELTQKSPNYNTQQIADSIIELKQILKKIAINTGILLAASVSVGLGVIYPSFGDYSLIGLNFWILFNLKFNNLSHGYYFVLLSLLAFQFLYFQKIFDQNKKILSSQRI